MREAKMLGIGFLCIALAKIVTMGFEVEISSTLVTQGWAEFAGVAAYFSAGTVYAAIIRRLGYLS